MTKERALKMLRFIHSLLDADRHADALQFCNEELTRTRGTDTATILKYRSYVRVDGGQIGSAILDLEEALKICPTDRSVLHALACTHAKAADWASAIIAAERLLFEEQACSSTYYLDEAYFILAVGSEFLGDRVQAHRYASLVSDGGSTWLGEFLTKDDLITRLS